MLDDLDEMRTFQRILALGSPSAAARDLGVSLAVVSCFWMPSGLC